MPENLGIPAADALGDYYVLRGHLAFREDLNPAGGQVPTLGALQANVASQTFLAGSNSTDTCGVVSITTPGAGPPGAGAIVAIVNFGKAFANVPVVFITDQNSSAPFQAINTGTGSFSIVCTNALGTSQTFNIGYLVVGK